MTPFGIAFFAFLLGSAVGFIVGTLRERQGMNKTIKIKKYKGGK